MLVHKYSIDAQVYTHNGMKHDNGVIIDRGARIDEALELKIPTYVIRPNYADIGEYDFDYILTEEELEENFYIGEVEKEDFIEGNYPYEDYEASWFKHKHISTNTKNYFSLKGKLDKFRRDKEHERVIYKFMFWLILVGVIFIIIGQHLNLI